MTLTGREHRAIMKGTVKLVDSLRRWATLAGLLGMAAGSLAIQACTRAAPGESDASMDASQAPDAALDASVQDSTVPQDAEMVDARLWDVMCE